MKTMKTAALVLSAVVVVQGCAMAPMGPTAQVMPGRGKPFEAFQQDQFLCKQYADSQVAGQAEAANRNQLGGVAISTVLGAGLGAAFGRGRGAAIGAASGAAVGTDIAAGNSAGAQGSIQFQYDNAYVQCMVAKGNRAPPPPPVMVQPPAYLVQPDPYMVQPGQYDPDE